MDFFDIGSRLTPVTLSYKQLFLDPDNPRFVGESDYKVRPNSDPESAHVQGIILDYLKKKSSQYDIRELRDSIEKVGFLKMDRIVVKELKKDKYLVIEGNRRTAAIKWLMDDVDKGLLIDKKVRDSVLSIDVLVLNCKDEEEDYISNATWFLQGLRHISGVKSWGPYQQAELISKFKAQGKDFREAGKALGIGPRIAARMLRAYKALNSMITDPEYSDKANASFFSHFEQAVSKPIISAWLGWDENLESFQNKTELVRFYQMITGTGEGEENKPVAAVLIREQLPKILESESARVNLMQGKDIDFCYGIATSELNPPPTWHAAVRGALSKLNTIPWNYPYSDDDINMLNNLLASVNGVLEQAKKSQSTSMGKIGSKSLTQKKSATKRSGKT